MSKQEGEDETPEHSAHSRVLINSQIDLRALLLARRSEQDGERKSDQERPGH